MLKRAHYGAVLLVALVAACSNPTPSEAPRSTGAASPTAALATAEPSPTTVAAAPTPPYRIVSGKPEQEPGSILFGDRQGNSIEPFAGYPRSFTIDRAWAFGAFFGHPIREGSVTVELFRQHGNDWITVSSVATPVEPGATGVLGSLAMFETPGTYRLDIRAEGAVVATSLMSMVPPCEGVCTGG